MVKNHQMSLNLSIYFYFNNLKKIFKKEILVGKLIVSCGLAILNAIG